RVLLGGPPVLKKYLIFEERTLSDSRSSAGMFSPLKPKRGSSAGGVLRSVFYETHALVSMCLLVSTALSSPRSLPVHSPAASPAFCVGGTHTPLKAPRSNRAACATKAFLRGALSLSSP
ncbi:unnamed protein product, partial [Laminaria digitata]